MKVGQRNVFKQDVALYKTLTWMMNESTV